MKRGEALPLVLARRRLQPDAGRVEGADESLGLNYVGHQTSSRRTTKPPTPLTQKKQPSPELPPPDANRTWQARIMYGVYSGQNNRAMLWAGLYAIGWILQRLWCHLGLPEDCNLAMRPLEVLTDLVVLFGFALAQAWWCEILEESRFEELMKGPPWVAAVALTTQTIVSALGLGTKGFEACDINILGDLLKPSEVRSTLFIFGLIATIFAIFWHFKHAWLTLPGTVLISGGMQEPKKPMVNYNGIYVSSRLVVVAWSIGFFLYILNEEDGIHRRGALLAWMLSLVAVFPNPVSYCWLAVTTGVFLEGIGAHRLRFLGCTEMH